MKIRVIHFDKEGFHKKALEEFQKKYGWDIENTGHWPDPPLNADVYNHLSIRVVGDPTIRYWSDRFKEIEKSIVKDAFVKFHDYLYLSSCLDSKGDVMHIVSDLNGENIKKIPNVDCKIIEE